jgi:predicted MFS family arabinose efflux permease
MIGWRGLSGAIYAGVVALIVVNVLPALVNVLAVGLKWDDRALGLLASADVAGITFGSLLGVPIVQRVGLRTIVGWSVVVLIAADLICGLSDAQPMIVSWRVVGGTASGLILAACYAVYSEGNPQRNFAAFSIGQMASGFIGVTAIPVLAGRFGWRSSFFAIAGLTAFALPLSMFLPRLPFAKNRETAQAARAARADSAVWTAIAGLVVYVIGEGAVWTFMERIGAASGISPRDVDAAVSACTLAGVIGAVVTLFPSKRLGLFLPLTLSTLLSVGAVGVMRAANPGVFAAALSVFTFTWLSFSTLQFAAIAKADTVGTATIAMSAAWYGGFTIGPYLAGELVVRYGFISVQYLGIGGVVTALLSLIPICIRRVSLPLEFPAA